MLPMEIVDRTFHIGRDDGSGTATAFSLDIGGRQYLVTAGHVVEHIQGPSQIRIFHDGNWRPLRVDLVGHSDIDVSVLAPGQQLTDPGMVLEAIPGGFNAAQEVFFAGFPVRLMGQNVGSPFPAPLVKRAIVSGKGGEGLKAPFYLDGHNNPGFSGGPVYLQPRNRRDYVVSMVICCYTALFEPVYDQEDKPTTLYVHQNSGIIQAFSIQNALDLIAANPIGFQL